MQGPLRGFHQDLHSTFSYGPLQHLGQDRHILGTAPSNSCKIVIEGPDQISLPGSHRINISTAPQREWSATHKVPRGLCERYQNWHRATRRAIGHVQSAETVARARSKFAPRHSESGLPRTKCREGCASDIRYQNWHRATRRAICHVQSAETVARARSKFAPRHSESGLPRTKCREGCASDIKIGTVPQGERSATCKVPKRLRERDPNSHRATARVVCHAQSAERVVRAISKLAPCHKESDLPRAKCRNPNSHRATARVVCHAQSAERVVRAISKLAPCHKESDLPRAKCRNGCASEIQIRTAPQREWSATHKVPRGLCERYQMAPCHKESDLPRAKCQNGCASEIQIRTAPQREWSATHKVPRGLCERYQNWHRATRRAICHVQSAETVARARSKFAPRHNESNLTGTKCREGCASDIKIGTVPQGERSATRKVPKRLRERDPNSHRATTRVIRHAQSHESLARAQNIFLQNIARTTKNEH